MNVLLPLPVLLPVALAALCALLPARLRGPFTLLGVTALAAVTAVLTVVVARGGELTLALAGWDAPLGIGLRADPPAVLLLVLTAVVGLAACGYAFGHPGVRGGPAFWPLLLALLGAVNVVYLADDLFNAYVGLELVTLGAVAMVALGGRAAAAPALRYLFVAVVGSLLYLLAVALVYGDSGTLDLAQAAERISAGPVLTAVLVLTLLGTGAKMALFPLHSWLPVAHPAAPAAVSALLSAVVVKSSLYVLWRVWAVLGGVDVPGLLLTAVGVAGSAGVLWGSVMALRRRRLKQVAAYSTVAQIGYLVLVLAIALPDGSGADQAAVDLGWSGGLGLALAHGLAKAALFLAAGTLALAYGSDRLSGLVGAVSHLPLSVATLGIAGASLAGLPPSVGFAAKWQLLQATLLRGQWFYLAVLLLGGLLTFAYTAALVRATFNRPGGDEARAPEIRPARVLVVVPFALALTSVLLGLLPGPLLGFTDAPGGGT